jgi:hypothetical protein
VEAEVQEGKDTQPVLKPAQVEVNEILENV